MIDWNNFREKFVKFIIIIFIILIVYLTLNIIFIVDFLFGLSFVVIGILIGWYIIYIFYKEEKKLTSVNANTEVKKDAR